MRLIQARYRCLRSVLAEKLLVCHCLVVETVVIRLRRIEEFSHSWVHLVVVLRQLDVKVRDPCKFTVNITVLGDLGPVWHARAFHFILFVRIKLPQRFNHAGIFDLRVLVEVRLQQLQFTRLTL